VTVTMNEILQDIKAKYDEAMKRKGDTKTQMLTLASSKVVVEEAMQDMSKRILDSCASIQNLCKNFNLVEELNITLQQLEIEAGLLTSFAAKKQANEFIESIKHLIDKLSNEMKERKKTGNTGGAFQYSDEREQNQIRIIEAERKRLEEEARKSRKQTLVIQPGNFAVKSEQLWKTVATKAKQLYYCDLIKVHDDDYVKPDNIPSGEYDLVIWIDTAMDFKEKLVADRLNGLKAEKKNWLFFFISPTIPLNRI